MDNKFTRVEADDPTRCQAITKKGQCPYQAMEPGKFCPMHGGNKAIEAQKREGVRNYRLTKWQNRVRDFAQSGGVKSLREEIGILRMVLEETLNKCENNVELLLYASKISDLVIKIEKLVSSCHRLENSMGMLLDKSAALHLAGQIVEIIGNHVSDSDIVDSVANDIARVLLKIEET